MINGKKIIDVLSLSATILVESGSEISRVHDTLMWIGHSFGIEDESFFITPTAILISFNYKGEAYTKGASINTVVIDLEKINQVNDLSRLCVKEDIDIDLVYERLIKINDVKGYKPKYQYLASATIAMFFTYFFGGALIEGVYAFIIGFLIQYFKMIFEYKGVNTFIKIILLSAFFTFVALVLSYFDLIETRDNIITGNLMLLVPGVALTSALRDSIAGDTLSGLLKGFEALLVSVGLVVGTAGVLSLWAELIHRGIL